MPKTKVETFCENRKLFLYKRFSETESADRTALKIEVAWVPGFAARALTSAGSMSRDTLEREKVELDRDCMTQ